MESELQLYHGYKVAWRKMKIWTISLRTHNNLVSNVTGDVSGSIYSQFHKSQQQHMQKYITCKDTFSTLCLLLIINIYHTSMV